MIKFYVNLNQFHNFVDLKEPVQLVTFMLDDNYIEFNCDIKQVKIVSYRTYSTIELMTNKKRRKLFWQKVKAKFTRKKI